jgi:hypothetical protein
MDGLYTRTGLGDETMTQPANRPRIPGTILLKIAPRLFSDHFVTIVVRPTIADLQSEIAAAGANRIKRLQARWRGYSAFWKLALVAPLASWAAPRRNDAAVASAGVVARLAFASTVLTLFVLAYPRLGVAVGALAAAGALFAILIHAWYERHPCVIPTPADTMWRSPQINFSSTEVAGNIGGLIFVVGSVVVVSVGLPSVPWFLLAATIAGCVLAGSLVAWHKSHPRCGLRANQIVLRSVK